MFFNIHTHHLSNSDNIIELYNQNSLIFNTNCKIYSIGIHPIYIKESLVDEELEIIRSKVTKKNCLAIGEIGLDKLCSIDFELQIRVFKQQLQIAEEKKKPVIIHCVRAYQEILHIRKSMKITVPFIFHGFNKNKQLLDQILQQNCFVSFGMNLIKNKKLQIIFQDISPSNFFLENDASDVSIQDIYTFASEIKKVPIKELEFQQAKNWKKVLGYEFQ